jgi:hypothetical protein
VSEEKVLRNVFGSMWKKVTGEWRKLPNEELRGLHFSINNHRMIKWKRMRWVGYVARVRGKRNIYRVLVGKPEGRKPVGRRRRRWEHNIEVGLQVTGWEGVSRSGREQFVGCGGHGSEPSGSIK